MTWKEIKLATLQKMFAAEGSAIPSDESTIDYIAGMPFVANEALQMLSTAGKFIQKSIQIEHEKSKNINDCRYNLKELAGDFFQLGENQVYYQNPDGTEYRQYSEYAKEGDSVLVLFGAETGTYTVYYRAYPEEITELTEDDYELPLDREVAVLLPLYMASQLYKDDDNGIATTYRNEFEVALERLSPTVYTRGYEEYTSESGWI
jgi:hypothetical protein